ncbi:MAG TPA: carboxypeptidase regulatory-like domain-containing protein [Vicinamibacterales bacterium]
MPRKAVGFAFAPLILALGSTLAAQTVRTGSIVGTITDESKSALPGVTITVTSPALQVPELTVVSGARGEYEIKDLPPGTYRLAFELGGFAKVVRPDVQLTTGFVARVDLDLKIAGLEETLVVSGQSPVVDVQTTRGGGTVSKEILAAIPNNRNYQDIMNLTPGMVTVVPPQAGVIGMKGEANGFKNYGLIGNERTSIEGIDMHSNENPDFAAVEEVDVKTFGNTAEVPTPGAAIQLIVKSGGNDFHGRYHEQFMTEKLQSNNIDAALKAQGIAAGDTAIYYQDLSGDLGGRIIRDQLWFYTALRDKRSKRTLPGYSADAGPDGRYGTFDDTPGRPVVIEKDQLVKVSLQASPKHRFIGFYSRNKWDEKQFMGNAVAQARFNPLEATPYLRYYNYQAKGEWNAALSSRLLANVMFGDGWYVATYTNECSIPDRAPCTPGKPAAIDLATQIVTGTPYVNGLFTRPRDRLQLTGSLSYFPNRFLGGAHEFKVGYTQWWERLELNIPDRGAAGNYQLQFDRDLPRQLVTANFPVAGKSATDSNAAFITDTWRATRRLTVNLGARFEYAHAYVPPQVKEQGVFGGSGSFDQIEGGEWWTWAPRAGLAFDVTGDAKTVVKGTYGWFNELLADGFANAYNPNTQTSTTYLWHDLNVDRLYQPGEVNLDLNGPDFISITGGSTTFRNPDLKKPYVQQATASIEREFQGSMSIRALYVFMTEQQIQSIVNVLRPYSAYSVPVVRQDPGPDGLYHTRDDAGMVTMYDYSSEYRGAAFVRNEYVNSPDVDHYNSFEVTLVKRPSRARWFLTTAFLATKNYRHITPNIQSPNDEVYNLDETWDWNYRLSGNYRAPYGLNVSSLYTLNSGKAGQRTFLFRQNDPLGGAPLSNTGNLSMRLEPYGASRGPVLPNWNLKVAKDFRFSGSRRVTVEFDVLNVMNTNPAWNTVYVSGPTYGQITSVQPPRIARFGASFEF